MSRDILPDPSTPYGRRVRERLRDETVIWLTTVNASGAPQPNPVWFLWTGEHVVIYNYHSARRLAGLRERPQVALHFNTGDSPGSVVVFAGRAEIDEQLPPAHESPEYMDKYGDAIARELGSGEEFSRQYPVPVRVHLTRVRGF